VPEQWTAVPVWWSIALFVAGWACGWSLLWRPRRLPRGGTERQAVAVVVPARDEAHIVGGLVAALQRQRRAGDQVVVVDDHSTDGTADVVVRSGGSVAAAPPLPAGWSGKPHACHAGAAATSAPVLVFVDADVTPSPTLLDDLAAALSAAPGELVSVQPWHVPARGWRHGFEQLSLIFNVVALMGSGAFSVLGPARSGRLAFGPVLACDRSAYDSIGGHGASQVRGAILEDIAMARLFPQRQLFVGSSAGPTFRMYPGGRRAMIEGWTKGIAIGAAAAPRWAAAGTAAWIASLAGGWVVSCWFAVATVVQLAVLARRAGRFAPWVIVLFPVATALFVVVVLRSMIVRRTGGRVTWRGRSLRPDQETG
jgi:4,4'-diaponeurosporenoate glycosyltransferase